MRACHRTLGRVGRQGHWLSGVVQARVTVRSNLGLFGPCVSIRWAEDWLGWHKRSLSDAWVVAVRNKVGLAQVVRDLRENWAGHISRLGVKSHCPHILKSVLRWRPLLRWRVQQIYNLISYDTPVHPFGWGKPRRWENGLADDWCLELFQKEGYSRA